MPKPPQRSCANTKSACSKRTPTPEDLEHRFLAAKQEYTDFHGKCFAYFKGLDREVIDAMDVPTVIDRGLLSQALRRVALALAIGDTARAHRALNDVLHSTTVPLSDITESTLLAETSLFDYRITAALEKLGIILVGDLIEVEEHALRAKVFKGCNLGTAGLAVVFEGRRKCLVQLNRSADAMAREAV
jgi:hypothetical protein